jgi:hypothetical protein
MAQYYTLEEAAEKLGLTPDAFRKKLATEWKTAPRRYPDGATLRFQVREVDELARSLGRASEPDVPLKLADDTSSDDFVPLSSEEDALGEVRREAAGKPPRQAGDSDVRLEPAQGHTRPMTRPGDHPTEEVDLDAEQKAKPPSSKKIKPTAPAPSEPDVHLEPSSPPEGSSEFELSLAPDSSDEFDLQLTEDSSEEVDIGVSPAGKGLKSGDSGINLQSPADSGISLEKSSDFDLKMEDQPPAKGPKTDPLAKQPAAAPDDSDSEFELTLDDSGTHGEEGATTAYAAHEEQKDIFETDFELPALDEESGSEAMALEDSTDLESSSDFDLAVDEGDVAAEEESGSEVVAIEDEEGAPRRRRRAAVAEGEELDELEVAEDVEEEEGRPVRVAAAEPAEWGALPAVVLIPCVVVMLLVGLMSWELLRGMWGYTQPGKVASPIVRSFAEMFGEKLPPE